jgi:hypothetical protein
MDMMGFVHIYQTLVGYAHGRGTSIRCRWPGSAEDWLNGLVSHGKYRKWERERTDRGSQMEYRGARVFRVYPAEIDERQPGTYESGALLAIWDTSGAKGPRGAPPADSE